MKHTTLDNPDIICKDERIIGVDRVVREVKQSEEWEAVRMSILSQGIELGKAELVLELIEEHGSIPEEIREHVQKEKNPNVLREWCRKAVEAESVDDFVKMTGIKVNSH